MVLKFFLLFFTVSNLNIKGAPFGYTYSNLAGGWLKLYKNATWSDATARCDFEGGVVASPVTCQIRDALRDYVKQKQGESWILTGVKADFSRGDFFSGEGVLLEKMPIIYKNSSSYNNECIKWNTASIDVQIADCNQSWDYVCFRRRVSVVVAGCGTNVFDYTYDRRSGSCYKFHPNTLSWPQAYIKCTDEGAHLAIVNNLLESLVLKDLYPKALSLHNAWAGIRDWSKDGKSWVTIQGQTLSEAGFEEWRLGHPTFTNTMHCVTFYKEGNYNNYNCDSIFPFICEKTPELLTHLLQ